MSFELKTLTKAEVCEVLHVSPSTVARLAARGLLNKVKGIRGFRVTVAELERFLKEQTL